MDQENYRWDKKELPRHYDEHAVDTTEIRHVFSTEAASVVHCTLPPMNTSVACRNIEIHEIWYFINGHGEIWLKEEGEDEGEEIRIGPNTSLTIPANVDFQFRSTSNVPLTFLYVVMPPWPGEHANKVVEGPWQPSFKMEVGGVPAWGPWETERDWRRCSKCQALWFGPNAAQSTCPAGGPHDQTGSMNYALVHKHDAAPPLPKHDAGWRWCSKCQALWSAPMEGQSTCPAGGPHDQTGSEDYQLAHYINFRMDVFYVFEGQFLQAGEGGWYWCRMCQGLWFYPNMKQSICVAGGTHAGVEGGGYYNLLFVT